jgi:hypothetical protein
VSAGLVLDVSSDPAEIAGAELLIAPWCSSDRPPRGAAGRVDWRMCGLVSQLICDDRLSGERDEKLLLATHGRLRAPRVLLLGMGDRSALSPDRAADTAALGLHAALDLGVTQIALSADVFGGLPADRMLPNLVRSLAPEVAKSGKLLQLEFLVAPAERSAARERLERVVTRGLRDLPMRLTAPSGTSRSEQALGAEKGDKSPRAP